MRNSEVVFITVSQSRGQRIKFFYKQPVVNNLIIIYNESYNDNFQPGEHRTSRIHA